LTLTEAVSESGTVSTSDFVLTIENVDNPPTVTAVSVLEMKVTLTLSETLDVVVGTSVTLAYTKSEQSGTIEDSSGNR